MVMHLATYIMMPFMAGGSMAAPAANPNPEPASGSDSTTGMNTSPQNPSNAGNIDLITSLQNAATSVDRLKLLPNDADHVYDFNNPPHAEAMTVGDGGHTVRADRQDFPALIGNGVSMTLGFIGPCGFNTPHTHPRSAEINIIVEGRLGTEYILENGLGVIRNELSKYQMTVFPQGAIHTEFNPDCTNATFVAGFASEDPGVQQSAQRLFDLDDDVLTATFANDFTFQGSDIELFRSRVPKNVALGVEACLQRCNIPKRKR